MERKCFRDPITEIFDSARYLDAAVSAYENGHADIASELFQLADDKKVWDWTDSVWGKKTPYVTVHKQPNLHTISKTKARMPDTVLRASIACSSSLAALSLSAPMVLILK